MITVVVCTYNRCQSLARTLNSLMDQTVPEAIEWEILVVDNNSSDGTREVVEEFVRRAPDRVRYVRESRQGLSHARNAGIRGARGEVLAFTDDDVTVSKEWLQGLTSGLHTGEWAGAGGKIVPDWNCPQPNWIRMTDRHALAPFVAFDPGLEPGPLDEPAVGANMAFRKEMFSKYGGFRTDLGHCAGEMVGNEDTEFGQRLLSAGEQLRYEPSAVVFHPVTENRVDKSYITAWWFAKGRADIRQFGIPADARWFVAGIPLHLFRRLLVWTLRWLVAVEPSQRFSGKIRVWNVAGRMLECHRRSRDGKQAKRRMQPWAGAVTGPEISRGRE